MKMAKSGNIIAWQCPVWSRGRRCDIGLHDLRSALAMARGKNRNAGRKKWEVRVVDSHFVIALAGAPRCANKRCNIKSWSGRVGDPCIGCGVVTTEATQ